MRQATSSYEDPRAHAVRARYLDIFGGEEIPVPVERIAEDLLGLRIEEAELGECSGMLLPAERRIVLNAAEAMSGETPIRRQRFTIAHELGHWVCHALGSPAPQATYCRALDLANDVDRALEREANIFASELLMPEAAVRTVWEEITTQGQEDPVEVAAAGLDVSPSAMGWRLFNLGLVGVRPTPSETDLAATTIPRP